MAFSSPFLLFVPFQSTIDLKLAAATDAAMSALRMENITLPSNAFNKNPGIALSKWPQRFVAKSTPILFYEKVRNKSDEVVFL